MAFEVGDQLELGVAVGGGDGGNALVVHAQGEAVGPQQAGHSAVAEREAELGEGLSQSCGGATDPAQAATGVAGGVVLEEVGESGVQSRVFFWELLT